MKKVLAISMCSTSILLFAVCPCNKPKPKPKPKPQTTITKESPMSRKTMSSGLSYEIIKEGSGESPQTGKLVTVHYTGWLDENGQPGKKFDSSVDRGMPFTFKIGVGQVIEGWDKGVMAMKPGEKRRLYVPSQLGYGASGAGAVIPPHADLIFDVELIEIR